MKEVSEIRNNQPNYKKMNNNLLNNGQGITVQTARLLKASVDNSIYMTPAQKFADKTAINSNISDSIDKEEEEGCDLVDFLAESVKQGIHQAASAAREQRAKAKQEQFVKELAKKIDQFGAKKPQIGM